MKQEEQEKLTNSTYLTVKLLTHEILALTKKFRKDLDELERSAAAMLAYETKRHEKP